MASIEILDTSLVTCFLEAGFIDAENSDIAFDVNHSQAGNEESRDWANTKETIWS